MKSASQNGADNRGPTPTETPRWNSPDEVTVWIWTDGAVGGPFTYAEVAQLERERGPIPGMLGKLPGGEWMPWPDLEVEIARGPRAAVPPKPPEEWDRILQRRIESLGSSRIIAALLVLLIVGIVAMAARTAPPDGFAPVVALVVLAAAAGVYFLPAIVASSRGHHQATAITVLNLVAGWTLVGWVVALVWAFVRPPKSGS